MLHTIMACGEYEKLMGGVFEMYLEVKFKDSMLQNVRARVQKLLPSAKTFICVPCL